MVYVVGSEGRKLRHAKRFMAIPSPITAVEWWRVCIIVNSVSNNKHHWPLK